MINNTYERLLKSRAKELNFYMSEIEARKKVGDIGVSLLQTMQRRRKAHNNLLELVESKIFDGFPWDEKIKNIEDEIIDVQVKESNFIEYLEVEFDDFFVEIENEDLVKFGLGVSDDFLAIATIIALKYSVFETQKERFKKISDGFETENENIRQLIIGSLFKEDFEKMFKKVCDIEGKIKEVNEVLPPGWGDTSFEVILEDSIIVIDRKEIDRYDLDATDKFKIAIVIAYLHMGE